MGSSSWPSDENALPCTEWVWAAAMTSGRAAWTWEWMANAAWLMAWSPCDDRAVVVDAHQVGDRDQAEVDAERVQPEPVGELGVAHGDVAGHALAEPEATEQPERGGEALLAVDALLGRVVERRQLVGERLGVGVDDGEVLRVGALGHGTPPGWIDEAGTLPVRRWRECTTAPAGAAVRSAPGRRAHTPPDQDA